MLLLRSGGGTERDVLSTQWRRRDKRRGPRLIALVITVRTRKPCNNEEGLKPAAARPTHAALLLCMREAWSGDTSTTSAPAKSSLRYDHSRLRFASRVSVDPNFIALPRGDVRELEAASGLRLDVRTRKQGLCPCPRTPAKRRRGRVELCVPGWPCFVRRQGRRATEGAGGAPGLSTRGVSAGNCEAHGDR